MTGIDKTIIEVPEKCRLTAEKKGTAVVYARTESDTDPMHDLRQQANKCFDFCAKNKLAVLKVFTDRCLNNERGKELSRAQSFCCEYMVTYLVVDVLSRVAIGVSDIERVEETMIGRGTSLLAVKLPNSGANELNLYGSLSNAFRKRDRSLASERTKLGMHRAMERGKICHRLPAGVVLQKTKSSLAYDPAKAPLILEAFFMLSCGEYSIADIARLLGSRGLINEKTGKPYTHKTMKRILSNPLYMGYTQDTDQYYYKVKGLEPLVSEDIFNAVQEILNGKV
jgi:DNA invertase Pin-like site-specific DNA recombinase